jgi:hypothetical protein
MTNPEKYRPKNLRPTENLDLENTYIELESKSWKRHRMLSLENLQGVLEVKVQDISDRNVTSVEYVNQEEFPELPPNTFNVNTKTHIAVDENYLYVWVPSLKRWKRTLLSNW